MQPDQSDPSKPKFTKAQKIRGGIVLSILAIIIIYFIYLFASTYATAPCDTFRYYQAKDIPARCLQNYAQ